MKIQYQMCGSVAPQSVVILSDDPTLTVNNFSNIAPNTTYYMSNERSFFLDHESVLNR